MLIFISGSICYVDYLLVFFGLILLVFYYFILVAFFCVLFSCYNRLHYITDFVGLWLQFQRTDL
jgi:hypothetical protein